MDTGHARLHADQSADRLRRAALGLRLQKPAQQDQRDDDCRRFEIDVHRPGRQQTWKEGRHHRIGKGRRCAHCDKTVHVGGKPPQRGIALEIKTTPRLQQDQRGQHELQHPACLHADGGHDQMMDGSKKMRAHFQREDGQAQHCRNHQVAAQHGLLHLLARRAFGIARGRGLNQPRAITDRLDRILQQSGVCRPGHGSPFGGQIDVGRHNARHCGQGPFYPRHTRGTGHAFDGNIHSLRRHGIAHPVHRRDQSRAVNRRR